WRHGACGQGAGQCAEAESFPRGHGADCKIDGVLQALDWDSGFFGFNVARVAASTMTGAEAREIAGAAAAMRARCLYFLSGDPASWRAAASIGFEPGDIPIEL